MELRHLRYFVSVAQEKSFTKAADKLFTAQPSLSQQIKDLEEEVGVQLFDRSSRQIQLTDEGQAFIPHALNAIESAKMAVAAARQVAQTKNNQIHIGFLNVAEIKIMPVILDQLKRQIPDLQIHIHSLTCLEQIQRLKNAELDLCFTRYSLESAEYQNICLLTEKVYLVASDQLHRSKKSVTLEYLQTQRMIMCEKNASPIFYDRLNHVMKFNDIEDSQMLWVTNVLQHINLINMGMGYSFVPEYLLKFLNDHVHIVEFDQELQTLELYATFAKKSPNVALKVITHALNVHAISA